MRIRPFFLLVGAVVAALALACERLAEPEPAKVLDGSALSPVMASLSGSGSGALEIVRSDVVEGGGTADGGTYLCYSVRDCWRKCPVSRRDDWSMWCSCKRVYEQDPWPLTCEINEIPNDYFSEGGGGGCGGGDDGEIPVNDTLADCPFDDIEGFFVTLDCTPSVERGQHVTCRAEPHGVEDESDVLYSWKFVPAGGVPLRGGALWENLEEVSRDSVKSATWTGRGVWGGTVRVTAVDGEGLQGIGTNAFHVDPRNWTTRDSLLRGDSLTNYINGNRDKLGMNSDGKPNSSSSSVLDILKGSSAVAVVADGPNKGYAYVESHDYHVKRYWHVNERLLASGPAEIPDTGRSPVNAWTYLTRRGKNPALLLAGTTAHERYGQNGAKGHQGQIKKVLTPKACGDVAALLEPLVADTKAKAERLRNIFEWAADSAFVMGVLHNHVYGNHGTGSPIVWWAPGYRPFDTLHVDRYDRSQAYNYTSVGCDWQSF